MLTELAKNLSSGKRHCGDDLELGKRAGGGDGGAAAAGEVVAVGSADAFDQAEGAQPMQLTRQRRIAECPSGDFVSRVNRLAVAPETPS